MKKHIIFLHENLGQRGISLILVRAFAILVIIRALLYRIKKLDFMKRNCRRKKKEEGKDITILFPFKTNHEKKF